MDIIKLIRTFVEQGTKSFVQLSAAFSVLAERFLDNDAVPTTRSLALSFNFSSGLDKDARRQSHIENSVGTLGFELLSFEQVFVEIFECIS